MSNSNSEQKARVDLKVLKAMSLFASTEETRYYLNGVCVELQPKSTLYVATDGHTLMAYRDDVFGDEAVNTLTGTYIIPSDICKAHKVSKEFALSDLIATDEGHELTLQYGDIGISFKPIDGVFPDWRKVVPQGIANGMPAQFNPEYVARFGKFGKALGFGLPFFAHNADGVARVTFGNTNFVLGAIMPVRAEGRMDGAPQWANPATREAA